MKDNNNCLVDINPDGMDIDELRELQYGFEKLTDYLRIKQLAMKSRAIGAIDIALGYEKRCDSIYKTLPESVKSW